MARLGIGCLPGPAGVCGTRTAFSVQPGGAVGFVRVGERLSSSHAPPRGRLTEKWAYGC